MKPASSQSGFTLIELLVAMLVGAMIVAGLTAITSGLGRDLRQSDAMREAQKSVGARETLAQLIESIRVDPEAMRQLVAQPDTLHARMTLPLAFGGGTGDVELAITGAGEAQQVTVQLGQELSGSTHPAAGAGQVLLPSLRDAGFDYQFDASGSGQKLTLVTLTWRDAEGSQHSVSAMPRVNGGGGCEFDAISQECRS